MTHTATAAVLRDYGTTPRAEPIELPPLRPDEVLVRIGGVGICHTDLTAAAGGVPIPLPAVLGHEGAGTVVEIGPDVTDLAVGDPVVLGFDSCRTCRNCARGRPAYCTRFAPLNYGGRRPDGSTTLCDASGVPLHGNWFGQSSFASLAIATERNAVRLPDDVPLVPAGPLGCGLQTGAGAVLRVLRPEPARRSPCSVSARSAWPPSWPPGSPGAAPSSASTRTRGGTRSPASSVRRRH